ncbi:filamentation protein-like protein [Macroventuria anomochaeta]|uniref:Filamentation protein-like protein n=1 Tax=Macroventuria anomochaeta TaxID=301207 RepID=A0ACB6SAK3_9PLEO|nr:filamentation protein-like protein [Macroventuria anomochaeta]KAF2630344.1 filamentation protein-like protein [Macroventuria anomochaeta]
MVTESAKAVGYIQQLDEARCVGRWKDVPELCRKVEKHAPHRRCLTLTGRSEAQIATYTTQRPLTAASTASSGLSQTAPTLLSAIEGESALSQEGFQATVCLGWLHYVLDEPELAVSRLPDSLDTVAARLSGQAGSLTGWSKVCVVKGTFLKGSAQEKTGATADAVKTYTSILPWLSSQTGDSAQFRMWTECLLGRLCQLSDQSEGSSGLIGSSEALQIFRAFDKFSEGAGRNTGTDTADSAKSRRLAWKSYYDTLSTIIRHDLPYDAGAAQATSEKPAIQSQTSVRLQQSAELKRVQTIYENLLIKETRFPKASESNHEIDVWVDSVIDNWRLLCGASWTDSDLGEGGKEGVGRSVIDILYRAATKTFHSTQILRYLFIVHASLAEFELAFKAYDSYIEIVTRGKDRAEQEGKTDEGVDNDSTVLRTSAEAIRLLCRFGCRKEAEKAVEIGRNLEKWLNHYEDTKPTTGANEVPSKKALVEPTALAVAYCAIGVEQAHWAQFTYEADTRAGIQAKAIQLLRKSLSPTLEDSSNIDALYALAVVLAETRDIVGAIKVAKRALSSATKTQAAYSTDGVLSSGSATEFGRERKLIPLWHLLALLLTSRSEYTAAEKACEAAFAQFGDPTILFGTDTGTFHSEHLKDASGHNVSTDGIVNRMGSFEKSGILQIKMTQLALIEVTDGALAAVDGCDELLALYGRLFGSPAIEKVKLQVPATVAPPKSSAGTTKGSIFRGRGSVRIQKDASARSSSILNPAAGSAPAIQVTEDGANPHANGHHHLPHVFHHHKHEDGQPGVGRSSSKLRKRSASLSQQSVTGNSQAAEVPPLPENASNGTPVRTNAPRPLSAASSPRKSVESSETPLRPIAHNLPLASPPQGHEHQPPRQDTRLPAPLPDVNYIPPDPRFSKLQDRRQKVSLLVDIWLFTSGLYARAQAFEDASEAIIEALKLVETFENELTLEFSTAKALADKGWGGGKSVEELWADAYTARGELLVAQSLKHEARTDFERALLHFPDHPQGIVGLSNILLDIYSRDIPMEPTKSTEITLLSPAHAPTPSQTSSEPEPKRHHLTSHIPSAENQLSPPELSRLAARDRAFGLLSTLTKLGAGWDYSEAWYALARAYEESGQIEKAKEVLWWCVELEDTHPVRNWRSVALGGFVL